MMIKVINVDEYCCDECKGRINLGFDKFDEKVIGLRGEGFHFCGYNCMNVFIFKLKGVGLEEYLGE
jgi:hypothetical protein